MRRSRSSATPVARESSESSSTRSDGGRCVSHSPTVQRRRTTVGPTRKDQSQHGDGCIGRPCRSLLRRAHRACGPDAAGQQHRGDRRRYRRGGAPPHRGAGPRGRRGAYRQVEDARGHRVVRRATRVRAPRCAPTAPRRRAGNGEKVSATAVPAAERDGTRVVTKFGCALATREKAKAEIVGILGERARSGAGPITYGDLARQIKTLNVEPHAFAMFSLLGEVSDEEDSIGRGRLSAYVVSSETGPP